MLTPVDIENKEFSKAFRGYDAIEVDEFMKSLVADYEKLYRGNAELKDKNAMLTETIGNYKGMEETMQNAILVAQKTAEDIKQNAYERAETIIKEAEHRAKEAINDANQSISTLEKTYLNLQREMNGFKAKMNALLSTYMQLLSEMPDKLHTLEYKEESIPRPIMEETKQPEAVDQGDTHIFDFTPLKEEEDTRETPTIDSVSVGFTEKRTPNPLVEELMQKNSEQFAQKEEMPKKQEEPEEEPEEEPFGIIKETVDKEPGVSVSSINLENLKNYDVFSDDSF